jgi:AcrR family transcriptional regulator
MSVEGIAAAARVGKTSIYRRYPGKRELVAAAISSLAGPVEDPPDTGNARRDFRDVIVAGVEAFRGEGAGFAMLGTLLAKQKSEPELMDLFRKAVIGPRFAMTMRILERGAQRGEVRADVPPQIVMELVSGSLVAHRVLGGSDDENGWLDAVIDLVWRGIGVDRGSEGNAESISTADSGTA